MIFIVYVYKILIKKSEVGVTGRTLREQPGMIRDFQAMISNDNFQFNRKLFKTSHSDDPNLTLKQNDLEIATTYLSKFPRHFL